LSPIHAYSLIKAEFYQLARLFSSKKIWYHLGEMKKEEKIKIIYMGTPDFALFPLKALIEHPRFEILSVVTQEDKKVGRKQIMTPPPIKVLAQEANIPVLQPVNVKDSEFIKLLENLKPDFIVTAAYGKILPKEILEIPKYSAINIHGSLLPKYRGASPIQQALLNGDKETGITIMQMSEEMDKGDIYLMKRLEIGKDDDLKTLAHKLSLTGAILLPFSLIDIALGSITPIPQEESKASYCTKIKKEDGEINWGKETSEQILNKIRAFSIWPNCHTFLEGKQFKILKAYEEDGKLKPGEIEVIDETKISVGTKKGLIIPKEVQIEGKKPMQIEEFLRGYIGVLRKTKSFTSKR
jgi:methionyl-tRNA formyltransferase